jgi:hypothetical protein
MAARICPRCSTRVDERRAKASPYCLSCGAPLGSSASSTFPGKPPGAGGGSSLPWILGGIALVVLLGVGGIIALIVVAAAAAPDPTPKAVAAGQPKIEVPSTATATATATPATAKTATPVPTARPTIATPTPTPPRPTATPFPIPTPPPTVTAAPTNSVATPGPFPRARAQSEVDRVGFGLASCKRSTGPFGAGSIRIDFEPDGRVGTLSRPPFSGTPVGSCISSRFLAIRIGPFDGTTQRIEKAFIIQE